MSYSHGTHAGKRSRSRSESTPERGAGRNPGGDRRPPRLRGAGLGADLHRHQPERHGKLRRPLPESAVARTKLAAGGAALLTLVPKPKFAARLDAARAILVREVETVKGEAKTGYRRLKVAG